MAVTSPVHVRGAAAFATLPGDSYEYCVDYKQREGAVWLKSVRTEREWECSIDNRRFFESDPHYCDQFTVEMELLELALHPRTHKTGPCKYVTLARSGDDLILQLSPKLYSQSNPVRWSPLLFTLKWVRYSGTLRHGASRDPPDPVEPAKPRVPRAEQQKEMLARFRAENKVLKAEKRKRLAEMKQLKSENDALQREVWHLRNWYGDTTTAAPARQSTKSEIEVLRHENTQLKQAHDGQRAQLIRLGGLHEFQRQHIEHLRRKIQELEQQLLAQSSSAGGQQQNRDPMEVAQRNDCDDEDEDNDANSVEQAEEEEHRHAQETGATAATPQNKRRRTSKT